MGKKLRILVTGSNGFLGKNLISQLRNFGYNDILECDIHSTELEIDQYCRQADFVYHLAGVNRPKSDLEYMKGNFGFTSLLLEKLTKFNNKCPIVLSSSVQAELNNPYGESKRAGEELLFSYSTKQNVKVYIYRFANLYGKWARPNYNSVVATFCYNISRGKEVVINDSNAMLNLCYIDDVVKELLECLDDNPVKDFNFCIVPQTDQITVGELNNLIESFKQSRESLYIPNVGNRLVKNLYSTYLSYIETDNFSYLLSMNHDDRGSFTEFIKTPDRGQVSVNISKPGIIKGNHWHHTKNEKFLVVAGKGIIRFRKIDSSEIIEYNVSGEVLEVVDIPVGYTHNIENTGDVDLVTIMWVNEVYDNDYPDTYFLEV